MSLRYLESSGNLDGTGRNAIQADRFSAIIAMEMSVLVVVPMLRTGVVTESVLGSVTTVNNLMDQSFILECLQRTIKRNSVGIGQ
jgi:hypothetical protein